MATKYIVGSVAASFAFAYACGVYVADRKVLGGEMPCHATRPCTLPVTSCCSIFIMANPAGTTPRTVATGEWWQETDRKFQGWPRTAGPPVAMNPISRQNFVVKSPSKP